MFTLKFKCGYILQMQGKLRDDFVVDILGSFNIWHSFNISVYIIAQWSSDYKCVAQYRGWINRVRIPLSSSLMIRSTSDRKNVGSRLTGANSMTANDGMESMTHETRLRRRAIKIWFLCHDIDGPRAIKDVCEFRPISNISSTPEEIQCTSDHIPALV